MGLILAQRLPYFTISSLVEGGSHCATREEIVNKGRTRAGVGPTVPLAKNYQGGRSHCTIREELEKRRVPLYY